MRVIIALSVVGWALLGSGCALVEDGGRNLIITAGRCVEETQECHRNKKWAKQAWAEVEQHEPRSKDYGHGFKEGYAEYLFRGGDGEPPVVAPPRYRTIAYQTPEGHQAVQDWFAGYRHGASVAQAQGAREWVTGPSSLRPNAGVDSSIESSSEAAIQKTIAEVLSRAKPPSMPVDVTPVGQPSASGPIAAAPAPTALTPNASTPGVYSAPMALTQLTSVSNPTQRRVELPRAPLPPPPIPISSVLPPVLPPGETIVIIDTTPASASNDKRIGPRATPQVPPVDQLVTIQPGATSQAITAPTSIVLPPLDKPVPEILKLPPPKAVKKKSIDVPAASRPMPLTQPLPRSIDIPASIRPAPLKLQSPQRDETPATSPPIGLKLPAPHPVIDPEALPPSIRLRVSEPLPPMIEEPKVNLREDPGDDPPASIAPALRIQEPGQPAPQTQPTVRFGQPLTSPPAAQKRGAP